jgi:hypothetical protein
VDCSANPFLCGFDFVSISYGLADENGAAWLYVTLAKANASPKGDI